MKKKDRKTIQEAIKLMESHQLKRRDPEHCSTCRLVEKLRKIAEGRGGVVRERLRRLAKR